MVAGNDNEGRSCGGGKAPAVTDGRVQECSHDLDKAEDVVVLRLVSTTPGGQWFERLTKVFCCELMAEAWLRGRRKREVRPRR